MTSVAPFTLLTAFSSSIHGGNPAAIVFHDLDLPSTTFAGIARNLNQPMTAFLSAKPLPIGNNDERVVAFNVRWFFASGQESPMCGHATLAAAKAVFERSDLVSAKAEIIELHTLTCGIMTARKVEGELIEIRLPASNVEEVSPDERTRLSEVFAKAFGRKVGINYIGKGGIGFEHYLLVEVDEDENLGASHVNAAALHESGFIINIITAASSSGSELFVSRMFAPGHVPGDEDPVCGSAHSLMVPYWYKKRGIPRGQETRAKQVSRRGGDLILVWEVDRNTVRLTGASTVLGRGELYLEA